MRDGGLQPQVGPALEDPLGVDVVDHDELRPAGGTRDEADVATRDVELVGEQPEQCLVRRTLHGRRRHPRAQDPIGNPIDVVGSTTGRQTDGKADVGRTQDNL
jgi:hypothetical protein